MSDDRYTYDRFDTLSVVRYAYARFEEGMRAMSTGPASYYLQKMEEYTEALFGRFAPFKKGDRVRLSKDIECTKGWAGMEPTLHKGALATVERVDYRNGKFLADLVFDYEAYKGDGGKLYERTERKHTFAIWETEIEKLPA